MITDPEILKELMKQGSLLPKEEMLEVARKKGNLYIGIPKEISFQERRVALVPETVSLLVANGHRVKVETKSGETANFTDNDYSEAGAEICNDKKEIFQCDLIFQTHQKLPAFWLPLHFSIYLQLNHLLGLFL